jgi:formiminoglutamate deiminase
MQRFLLRRALLPDGWASDVRVEVDAHGTVTSVTGSAATTGVGGSGDPAGSAVDCDVVIRGPVVPGVPNVHSHAFQRVMSGWTERADSSHDSFWTWREVMYAFVDRFGPDEIEAVSSLAYVEMLESGFTAVGEFHYLHHSPSGDPYDDPAETGGRVCAAAERTGIGLTLLPVFYRHGGFGPGADARRPAEPAQRRFVSRPDVFERIVASTRRHASHLPGGTVGIAPHSLRAATTAEITEIRAVAGDGPIHIHVAEQMAEVEAAIRYLGARPVAHLLDTQPVDERWCLVHATHLDDGEVVRGAASGAAAGLCPVTEANLGDGLFRAREWLDAGGSIGVGSDSNVRIDPADELRTLEYGHRLVDRRRAVLADPYQSTGRTLFDRVVEGGARALGRSCHGIAPGGPADFVVLDGNHPVLAGRDDDALLDTWIFGADARVVDEVWARGRQVVAGGRAIARDAVEAEWFATVRRMGAP